MSIRQYNSSPMAVIGCIRHILLVMAIAMLPMHAHSLSKTERMDSLRMSSREYLKSKDWDRAIDCSQQLLALDDKGRAAAWAYICMGQAYMAKGDATASYVNLRKAEQFDRNIVGDSLLASFYNGMGLYTLNFEKDYYRSLDFYAKGLEVAKRSDNKEMYALLLNNIVSVYYLKSDATGLEYALEALEIARQLESVHLLITSSLTAAYMRVLAQEYDEALVLAEQVERLVQESSLNYKIDAYELLGNIYTQVNQPRKAEESYQKALNSTTDNYDMSKVHLGLGNLHVSMGEYEAAIADYSTALRSSFLSHSPLFRDEIFKGLSTANEKRGNISQALDYYKRYTQAKDSLQCSDNERAMQEFRAKFDLERRENLLNQQRVTILRKQNQLNLLIGIVLFAMAAAGIMLWQYTRKGKLYKAIVRQNQAAIKTQQELKDIIADLEKQLRSTEANAASTAVAAEGEKYNTSSLSDEKSQQILTRLELVMMEERPYTDSHFTKEKLAMMLETNRSYLSQTINEHYKMSFSQYVNGYRMRDAVRLLSDPDCDTPLKAICADLGFNSMTTFYNLFKEETGMTPTAYRDTVRKK